MQTQVQNNVALSPFTTYKTGGPAQYFGRITSWEDALNLREFAKTKGLPFLLLGGGSNILLPDQGFPGVVGLNDMKKVSFQNDTVTAESGVNMTQLVLLAAQKNLGGMSGMANVPGSVGGAVYGNAGIPDVCIADLLIHASILPYKGNSPMIVEPDYCQFSYRNSAFKKTKDLILSATFQLKPMPSIMVRSEVNQYIKTRSEKQPWGLSCGSFFKNPGQFPSAGWLIEQSGCKGLQVGGAQVSEKHANFILNIGGATTHDILTLALQVQEKVHEKFNITLEPEVQIFVPGNLKNHPPKSV